MHRAVGPATSVLETLNSSFQSYANITKDALKQCQINNETKRIHFVTLTIGIADKIQIYNLKNNDPNTLLLEQGCKM